jgi:hypothetical protein
LEDYRLVVNPYNPCVANMVTKSGKQLTVIQHVGNLMVLCKDNFELTLFSCYLGKIYGPKLSMHMEKKQGYLGVDIEFNKDRTLDVSMITYLKNVLAGFPEEVRGKAATPVAVHLFLVRDRSDAKVLEEERALAFHHTVAQLLFMRTRARRDIDSSGVPHHQSERTRRG